MTPYQTCCLYRSLKLHFTSDYDFIKYQGKVKYYPKDFATNNHKFVYERLASKYKDKEIFNFIISNLLINEQVWIQEFIHNPDCFDIYKEYNKKIQSLSYTVENDLINIQDNKSVIKVTDGEFPKLLRLMLQKQVCMETIIIMDDFMDFIPYWNKNIKDDILWPKVKFKLKKYGRILQYDKIKFKEILKKSLL